MAFEASMGIFRASLTFSKEEKYALTDQIRRSSRAVCANLAEAFRKRKYPKSFVAKLIDCEGEAAETQVWLKYSLACEYITKDVFQSFYNEYDKIIGKLVIMGQRPEHWSY